MAVIIQVRRDTKDNWEFSNPVLAEGEIGLELDTMLVKIGDGTTDWMSLGYQTAANSNAVGGKTLTQIEQERDQAILVAKSSLGTNFSVATLADRDALTDLTVGDKVHVEDDGDGKWAEYYVVSESPITFTKIMDQDVYLNTMSKEAIKASYESNPDTNVYSDSEKSFVDIGTQLNTVSTTLPTGINELKDNIEAVEATLGTSAFGVYTPPINSNYLGNSTSFNNADQLLDEQIKAAFDAISAENSRAVNAESSLDNDLANERDNRILADNTLTTNLTLLSEEVDRTQAGAGLGNDGTYTQTFAANYISTADSLHNADELLDSALKAEETRAIAREDSIYTALDDHRNNATNPHNVTKEQVGLGFVDNTADIDKPVSNPVQTALNLKENKSEKGQPNGYPELDSAGKIPSTQLPSFVDDVQEFNSLADFPATGASGVIYVALDTNKSYRWSGTQYIYITSGAVDSVAGKTGVVVLTKADVGLGSVDNTADIDKPVSNAMQTALDGKADLNGSVTARFNVADAQTDTEALSKGQLAAAIQSIDGTGSGIDADMVDGVEGSLLGIGGAGYAYSNETANRAFGADYTAPNKAILVTVTATSLTAGEFLQLAINGNLVHKVEASSNGVATLSTIVPANAVYSVAPSDFAGVVDLWVELS